jgi:hypothetical protein
MHKLSMGGWLAAVCSLVLAVAAQAQAGSYIFESGNTISQSPPAPAPAPASGDIIESGPARAPRYSYPVAVYAGVDPGRPSQVELGSEFNQDPSDPFYYAIPSTDERRDIFGSLEWTLALYQPTTVWAHDLLGATNGTIAPSLQGATNGWPSLQGSTRGTSGPQVEAYIGDIFSMFSTPRTLFKRSSRVRIANSHPTAALPVSGWKYNPSQPRWEPYRLPIKVYISGYVEAARGGLVRQAITSALRQWSQASNGAIRYQITSRYCEADVHFVDGLTDDYEFAQTCVDYHKGPIDHAKVIFLTSTLAKLPEARVKGLCLHEIGHVFGILKHSKNDRDAMSEMAIDEVHPVTLLSEKDKHVMAALYRRWDVSNNASLRVASAISGTSGRSSPTK